MAMDPETNPRAITIPKNFFILNLPDKMKVRLIFFLMKPYDPNTRSPAGFCLIVCFRPHEEIRLQLKDRVGCAANSRFKPLNNSVGLMSALATKVLYFSCVKLVKSE